MFWLEKTSQKCLCKISTLLKRPLNIINISIVAKNKNKKRLHLLISLMISGKFNPGVRPNMIVPISFGPYLEGQRLLLTHNNQLLHN